MVGRHPPPVPEERGGWGFGFGFGPPVLPPPGPLCPSPGLLESSSKPGGTSGSSFGFSRS
eukprot:11134648-Alexandrium_andersonii.AAC.1